MPVRRVGFYALSLFRSEVLSERSKPQWDQIVISRSRGLNTLCLVLLSTSAVGVGLLLAVEYAPKIRVAGYLEPEGGTTDVIAQAAGTVTRVFVGEDDGVIQGEALMELDHTRFVAGGQRATELASDHLHDSLRRLADAASVDERSYHSAQLKLERQVIHLLTEQGLLQEELKLATERWSLVESTYARVRQLAIKGVVSRAEWQAERERLLGYKQSLSQLRRLLATGARRIVQFEQERLGVAQTQADERQRRAERRAELRRNIAALEERAHSTLVAPKAGVTSFLQVKIGDYVALGEVVLSIVGENPSAALVLSIGADAVNDVRIGDAVRFRVLGATQRQSQAGRAVIQELSRTPQKTRKLVAWFPVLGPTYRARAEITELPPGVSGQRELPVEARVLGERRSLWRWLLTPLLAAWRGLA